VITYLRNRVILTDATGTRILGDFNGDAFVDIRDYGIWRQNFGAINCGNPADQTGDCNVDIQDYRVWRQNFGTGTPPGPSGPAVSPPAPAPTPGLAPGRR